MSPLGFGGSTQSYQWLSEHRDDPPIGASVLSLHWSKELIRLEQTEYEAVEYSSPAAIPSLNRVFVGTSRGKLLSFDPTGNAFLQYDAGAPILASPVVDAKAGEIYVVSSDGMLHALDTDGLPRWQKKQLSADGAGAPVLNESALFVVTKLDDVVAISREYGEILWTFSRRATRQIAIGGHAGAVLVDGSLITAFTDGTVVALNERTGRVQWSFDTTLDLDITGQAPVFTDVDTTPVVMGELVFVAGYQAGLFALSKISGSEQWRNEDLTGVIGLDADPETNTLIASSASRGVIAIQNKDMPRILWEHRILRGAPTPPVIYNNMVFVAESRGALLALSMTQGRERTRLESSMGFTGLVSIADGLAFAFNNAGRFFCMSVQGD